MAEFDDHGDGAFVIAAMPLTAFWDEGEPFAQRLEGVRALQALLSEQVGRPVAWREEPVDQDAISVEEVPPYALYALSVVAAAVERDVPLDDLSLGEAPWDHPLLVDLVGGVGSRRFPQLLHGDTASEVAWTQTTLEDLCHVQWGEEAESGTGFAVGSIAALEAEIDALGEALGMAAAAVDKDFEFDEARDPLAAARLAWLAFKDGLTEAQARGWSLIRFYDEGA